jgi:hypothetical protein
VSQSDDEENNTSCKRGAVFLEGPIALVGTAFPKRDPRVRETTETYLNQESGYPLKLVQHCRPQHPLELLRSGLDVRTFTVRRSKTSAGFCIQLMSTGKAEVFERMLVVVLSAVALLVSPILIILACCPKKEPQKPVESVEEKPNRAQSDDELAEISENFEFMVLKESNLEQRKKDAASAARDGSP